MSVDIWGFSENCDYHGFDVLTTYFSWLKLRRVHPLLSYPAKPQSRNTARFCLLTDH